MAQSAENVSTPSEKSRDLLSFEKKALRAPTEQLEGILRDSRTKYPPDAIRIIERVLEERRSISTREENTGTLARVERNEATSETGVDVPSAQATRNVTHGDQSIPSTNESSRNRNVSTNDHPLAFLGIQAAPPRPPGDPGALPALLTASGVLCFILGVVGLFTVLNYLGDDDSILALMVLFYHAAFGVLFISIGKLFNIVVNMSSTVANHTLERPRGRPIALAGEDIVCWKCGMEINIPPDWVSNSIHCWSCQFRNELIDRSGA